MKKIILILIIFLVTGCTSYTELNDLSIVNTLGIDYQDNYNLYLSTNNKTLTASNKTIEESFNDIYLSSNKQVYLSHINLLILTKEAINYNLKEIINNFLKNNYYRNNFYVIIMNRSDMLNFFNNEYTSDDITGLININYKETSTVYPIDFEEFIKELLVDNNYYLPNIGISKNKLTINGYTLIKDNKVYKDLSIKESIILNILTNHFNALTINNINIYEGNTSIKVNKSNITYNINLTTDTKDINPLKKEINNFLTKYKQDYDILKTNNLIRKYNYNYYVNNNKDLIKKITYNIKIKNTQKENYVKVR